MSERFSGIPKISKHITTRFIGDEAFLMNIDTLNTYYLNETASRVWSLINGSTTFDEIVHELMERYDVARDECTGEVSRLLDSWSTEQLIDFAQDNA